MCGYIHAIIPRSFCRIPQKVSEKADLTSNSWVATANFSCAILCHVTDLLQRQTRKRSHNLERRMLLRPWGGEFLRAEANGCPFKDPPNLISQPSTFLGTQTSNRTWPSTLCALMLGALGREIDLSFCSSCKDPESLPLWFSAELGKKKWSLGSTATLLRLWLEFTATFRRSQISSDISSCMPSMLAFWPSSSWILWQKTIAAFSRKWVTDDLYCIG